MIFTSICYKRQWLSVSFHCKLCVRASLSFLIFLKMTYENFSSPCESTVYHVHISMNKPSLHTGASCLVLFYCIYFILMASQHQSCCQLIDLICLSHHLFHQVLNLQQKSAVNAQLKIWDLLSTCAPPDLFWHHTPFLVCIMKVADDTRL